MVFDTAEGNLISRCPHCKDFMIKKRSVGTCRKKYYSSFMYCISSFIHVLQWNLSNPDTLGTEESVLISEVS